MRTTLACVLFSIRLYEACAELVFRQLPEGHTLQLSCSLGEQAGPHTELHLYHCGGQSQTTLLSVAEGVEPKVNPEHRGRLRLRGGLSSPQVNVSVSALQRGDSGLYVCERSSRGGNTSEQVSVTKVLLLVEGKLHRHISSCNDLGNKKERQTTTKINGLKTANRVASFPLSVVRGTWSACKNALKMGAVVAYV
uniref:Ig-like domain-containing protein n=1 Tax=Tetraodon nigroviridis TaxID=99883 RepID=H3CI75_TETNG